MTRKSLIKLVVFGVAVLMVIPLGLLGFTLVGQFSTYFRQGADTASIFRGHSLLIPDAADIRWASMDHYHKALPTLSEQEEIVAAYWLAWEALTRAQRTNDTADMATYWAGAAYQQALQSIESGQAIMQSHTRHLLRLAFFSDDNSVVAFEDDSFALVQSIDDTTLDLTASAQVVMTLDQGFWRVRSMILSHR